MTRSLSSLLKGAVLPFVALATIAATPLSVADWVVDPAHSKIGFTVNHFFTPVDGQFDEYTIDLDFDRENPANSSVSVEIQVASVNTANERRNNHLLSGDFFEAETHPTITFESTSVTESGGVLQATGPLTIKGVTKEVTLPIEVLGVQDIPADMQQMLGGATAIASFKTAITVDRRDFGVGVGSWAATLVVGGDVTIDIAVEAALK